MAYRVIFSPTAVRDLAESVSYIARHDPAAAVRAGDRLIDTAEILLSTQPLAGPRCPEYPGSMIRYWLHQNYRIVYEVSEHDLRVDVLRFWHCARGDWPVDLR
jgi:plasmid stabilization system protein ParE